MIAKNLHKFYIPNKRSSWWMGTEDDVRREKLLSFLNFSSKRTKRIGDERVVWVIFPVAFCDGNYFKVFLRLGLTLDGTFFHEWVEVSRVRIALITKTKTFAQALTLPFRPKNPFKDRDNRWKKCHYHAGWTLFMISQCIQPSTEKSNRFIPPFPSRLGSMGRSESSPSLTSAS